MELKKKTVLVTGSSRGIGRAIALAFGRAGYNVALNASKSAAQLEETKSLLESEAIPVLAVLADVSDYEGCKLLFAKIEETFGMVDVLVNNAGISHIGLFTDMTPAEWNHVLDVNLGSVLNCTHLAVPAMVSEKDGVILNISSMSAIRGIPDPVNNNGIYTATKFAINGFTECMQKYLLKYGIRVTALCPGSTATSWWTRWTHSFGTDAMLPVDTLADIVELIVTSPEKVLFKQLQVLPTVEIDNF